MEKDIKVMDTIKKMEEEQGIFNARYVNPLAFFAECVGMTRQESTGVSIEDIAKCFKAQFDEVELKSLIKELNK